ncbi:glycoside hydrolase domain-containing protein [Edaphobacter aggregans]|uniref:glycoside hydrolase domain-containing protein n=1 Tax=Edaphobacter aggregans TaxID=570835 RepID=UPI000557B248|nr:glycoside hydrolase domain-containing protein [Edaphobacter aggregans]
MNLPGGKKFTGTAHNTSAKSIYILSAKLNDTLLKTPRIEHDTIMHGGTLEFTMGPEPNHQIF